MIYNSTTEVGKRKEKSATPELKSKWPNFEKVCKKAMKPLHLKDFMAFFYQAAIIKIFQQFLMEI